MAKDDRKIHHAIRVGATETTPARVFRKDEEADELAAAVGPEELQRLFEAGDISGNWKGVKAEKVEDEPKSKKGK